MDVVELRPLGRCWGQLSDDGRYLDLRRQDTRVAWVDLVATARLGRTVIVRSPAGAGPEGSQPVAAGPASRPAPRREVEA